MSGRPTASPTSQRTVSLSLRDLVGYIGTWSAVARAKREEGVDPVAELAPALQRAWGPGQERKTATWPIQLRIGRQAEPGGP